MSKSELSPPQILSIYYEIILILVLSDGVVFIQAKLKEIVGWVLR